MKRTRKRTRTPGEAYQVRESFLRSHMPALAKRVMQRIGELENGLARITRLCAILDLPEEDGPKLQKLQMATGCEVLDVFNRVERGLVAAEHNLVWLPIWPLPERQLTVGEERAVALAAARKMVAEADAGEDKR